MTPAILGLATAAPARSIEQSAAAALALELSRPMSPEEARLLRRMYERAGIETRGSMLLEDDGTPRVLIPATDAAPRGVGTSARMEAYASRALELARRACAGAMADAGGTMITHLVTASCTGFAAPGWDAAIIEDLGLARTVRRVHVGFMGCHGMMNAIDVAASIAAADGTARVLVCAAEICSLHLHQDPSPDQVIANAIFADGAAACVVGAARAEEGIARVAGVETVLIPGTAGLMTWRIGDFGFEMSLGREVPEVLGREVGPWVRAWLDRRGLGAGDVASWAVHPGGPSVLEAVAGALELDASAMSASRGVLARHGNMSSPTVAFILDELRRGGALPKPCVVLGFGPGLTAVGLLLT